MVIPVLNVEENAFILSKLVTLGSLKGPVPVDGLSGNPAAFLVSLFKYSKILGWETRVLLY